MITTAILRINIDDIATNDDDIDKYNDGDSDNSKYNGNNFRLTRVTCTLPCGRI